MYKNAGRKAGRSKLHYGTAFSMRTASLFSTPALSPLFCSRKTGEPTRQRLPIEMRRNSLKTIIVGTRHSTMESTLAWREFALLSSPKISALRPMVESFVYHPRKGSL